MTVNAEVPGGAHGAGVAATLLARLDEISTLVDEGKQWKASVALSGRRWLEGVDLSGVPAGPLRRAQQWVDAARDVLHSPPVDEQLFRRLLLEARRALAS